MTRIQKVAELAGVSTATVSRALAGKPSVSPATRERVEKAARELGYVVSATASSLASGRNRNVGIVMPFLNRWFFTTAMAGAHRVLTDAGYDVTLYHCEPNRLDDPDGADNSRRSRLFADSLLRKRTDGLIMVTLSLTAAERTSLHGIGKPVIALDRPQEGITALAVDNLAIAHTAMSHLLELGHTRIGFVGGIVPYDLDFHVPLLRRQGYEAALVDAGIDLDPALARNAEFTVDGGYGATLEILDADDPPTALFAASDEMALGAHAAIRDRGLRIPEDVSLIGIDGNPLAEVFGITTIDQHPDAQGAAAARELLKELEPTSPHAAAAVRLPFELVERRSTARARD